MAGRQRDAAQHRQPAYRTVSRCVRRTSRIPAGVMTASIGHGRAPGLVAVSSLCFTGGMDEDVKDDYFARLRTRLGEEFRL